MTTRTRRPGEFCWINMLTPNPPEAMAFFGKLLGWTYFEIPGLGHGVRVGGRDVGGLFDLNGPSTPPGCPAMIGVMVKVDSADAAGAKVIALGGKAMPAFDIGDSGRMAVCLDPNGAQFDVWEPKTMHGTDVDPRVHGAPTWFETMTSDPERAATFYSRLFGWVAETMPMPGGTYTLFKLGGEPVAGMLQTPPTLGPIPPHWATYFAVDDADGVASEAAAMGGTVCVPPQDIAGVGRLCGILSPQGVMFHVIKYVH